MSGPSRECEEQQTESSDENSPADEIPPPPNNLLLDLPAPLAISILTTVFQSHGLNEACRAALVCKRLHTLVEEAAQHLTSITLQYTWASDACMALIAARCHRLDSLSLSFSRKTTCHGLTALASSPRASTLTTLCLRSCAEAVGCGSCLSGLTALTDLDLSWGYSVTSASLRPIATRLRKLNLHGCELINDEICDDLPLVEDLNLAYTRVSNTGLQRLAASCPQLHYLTIAKQHYNISVSTCTTEQGEAVFSRLRPEVLLLRII